MSTEQRMHTLERRVMVLGAALIAIGCGVLGVVLLGAYTSQPVMLEELRVQRVVIVDTEGTERMVLGVNYTLDPTGNTFLHLRDSNGRMLLEASGRRDHIGLWLFNPALPERTPAWFRATSDDTGQSALVVNGKSIAAN